MVYGRVKHLKPLVLSSFYEASFWGVKQEFPSPLIFFAFIKYFFLVVLSIHMIAQLHLLLHHHWDWEVDWTETED